jgi:hypothetical protein
MAVPKPSARVNRHMEPVGPGDFWVPSLPIHFSLALTDPQIHHHVFGHLRQFCLFKVCPYSVSDHVKLQATEFTLSRLGCATRYWLAYKISKKGQSWDAI